MGAINTSQQLAKVRAKIDAQQQVVARLELELAQTIVGGSRSANNVLTGTGGIQSIYSGIPDGAILYAALKEGIKSFDGGTGTFTTIELDQDLIRQMLYQARALLGELRIEEQHYNQEVQQEQSLRKSLIDLSKA
ncbi:MAG: hypothetical protein ACKO3R_06190 [bacterium]